MFDKESEGLLKHCWTFPKTFAIKTEMKFVSVGENVADRRYYTNRKCETLMQPAKQLLHNKNTKILKKKPESRSLTHSLKPTSFRDFGEISGWIEIRMLAKLVFHIFKKTVFFPIVILTEPKYDRICFREAVTERTKIFYTPTSGLPG